MVTTTRTDEMGMLDDIRNEAMDKFYRLKKVRESGRAEGHNLQFEHAENEGLAIALKASIARIAQNNLVISHGNLEQRVKQVEMQEKKMKK